MSKCEFHDVRSGSLSKDVEVSILLPDAYDAAGEALPLIVQLHGGGGNRHHLSTMAPLYDSMFGGGTLRPCVVASFSAGAGMYIGFEEFVAAELPDWVAREYNAKVDPENVCLTGVSMGGFGTLHVGLSRPKRFRALAALEPAIEPSFTPEPPDRRSTWWRNDESLISDVNDGKGMDMKFVSESPARVARDNAEEIRSSGVEIYLEAGDEDYTNLHDGAEFLHRVLWDNDIRHEYHLVRWADHVGASLLWRTIEAHRFIDGALGGGRSENRDLAVPEEVMQRMLGVITDPDYAHTAPEDRTIMDILNGPYGASAHALMYTDMRATAAQDPDLKRNYAKLPPTR